MSVHNEGQFQRDIAAEMVANSGWQQRPAAEVDRATRLLVDDLVGYLEATQPAAVEKFASVAGAGWQQQLADIVANDLDKEPGRALGLLRGGKKVRGGVRFSFCQFKPANDLNFDLVAAYQANRLTVVLEAPVRKPDGTWGEVDLALYVNGIPVADAELKNSLTGQSVKQAVRQYRHDRDPGDTLLGFRSVVHFAVDTDAVMMATRLTGPTTRFLPFNRGSSPDGAGGAGNYNPGDGSHKTSYLWRQVWQRDNWLDLLHRFVHVTPADPADPGAVTQMIFPRFHQWDAVRKLEAHARTHGTGQSYLVVHSAGSGKSNTIGWLAHRLTGLTDPAGTARVFDKVIVITDRRVLDAQLSATVAQFEHASAAGKVVSVDSSRELADALSRPSTRIVVSTLQKFPFAAQLEAIRDAGGGRYAVLIDEAHSSQSGESAKQLKEVLRPADLGAGEQVALAAEEWAVYDDADPVAEAVAASAKARGRPDNVSLFAFTATPKGKTLELFGTRHPDGKLRPFHLYSMRQAIEEGFILDTLRNYTTYATFWKVTTDSGAEVEKSKASSAVTKYAVLHPAMIAEKSQVIVEHYRQHVRHRIGGQAKAMVVTRSRLAAVRYKQALDRYIAEQGYDLGVVVAFSGKVQDPDAPEVEHTEASMNGFGESQTVRRFDGDDMHLMVVAEKYQTGFDQPKLHTMYVDKKLDGVAAVQTLGRLNRSRDGKDDTFVLDFVNDRDGIAAAFEPFYDGPVGVPTDDQTLYEVWQRLEDHHVLDEADLATFAQAWFTSTPDDRSAHPLLHAALAPAEARFEALDEERQETFRTALAQFTRMYAFLAQVLPYADEEFEKAYPYAKMLLKRIGARAGTALDLSDELELTHLKLAERGTEDIHLEGGEHDQTAFTGTGQGSLTDEELALLSEVVDAINDRFGAEVTDDDKIFYQAVGERMSANPELQQQAAVNDEATFQYAFNDAFMEAVIDAMEHNTDLGKRLLDDPAYASIVKTWMLRYVHRRAAERHDTPELDLEAP
ncbi:type I restriction endonuclease subunit R [Egicoccus sp. AB-alg2]|uniref:type I restriction endonuclease subunit R n=1 Tax=Egicoccus sp. AB-alg2 TaxID=3242693 RepID=UPI00359EF0A5